MRVWLLLGFERWCFKLGLGFRIRVRVCIYYRLQHNAMFCNTCVDVNCRRVCAHHHMHASEEMLRKQRDEFRVC